MSTVMVTRAPSILVQQVEIGRHSIGAEHDQAIVGRDEHARSTAARGKRQLRAVLSGRDETNAAE